MISPGSVVNNNFRTVDEVVHGTLEPALVSVCCLIFRFEIVLSQGQRSREAEQWNA
jgi:hypothetical protein